MAVYIFIFIACIFGLFVESVYDYNTNVGTRLGNTKNDKVKKIINISIILLLVFITGTRNVGGTDITVYQNAYNSIPNLGEFFANYEHLDDMYTTFGFDRGFLLLNSFANTIGLSFQGFLMMVAIISYGFFYAGIRRFTDNFSLVVIVFLYKMFFYDTFISIRQSITIFVFFYMIKYIEEKKFIKYAIGCIVMYYMHAASIILILVYFVSKIKLTKRLIIALNCIFIPTMILSFAHVPVLKPLEPILNSGIFGSEEIQAKATNLITGGNMTGEEINLLHTIEYFIIMAIILIFYDRLIKAHPKAELAIKMFICLLPIFTLFREYALFTRLKDYFTIFYGVILSYLALAPGLKYKELVKPVTVAWSGFGYFRFIILFDGGTLMNYACSIFNGVSFFK